MGNRMGGVWPLLGTYALWGVSPIFYHALADVPAAEVLAHRTIWSLVLFGAVLAAQGRLATLPRALASRHLGRIVLAALMISLNWGVFIWSVQNDHVMESSLGYYIFPLTAVVLGIVVFKERLHPEQRLAVILAALAVGLLAVTAIGAVVGYAGAALGWRLWIGRKWARRHARGVADGAQ